MQQRVNAKALLLCLCVGTLCPLVVKTEVFSSMSKLKRLPQLEKQLILKFQITLNSTLSGASHEVDLLRRKLDAIHRSNRRILTNVSTLHCPLHAFRMVKRLVHQWSAVLRLSNNVTGPARTMYREFINTTEAWLGRQELWPTNHDVQGAAMALIRLHHVYQLSYHPLIGGHFLNMSSKPLTLYERILLSRAALRLELFHHVVALSEDFVWERGYGYQGLSNDKSDFRHKSILQKMLNEAIQRDSNRRKRDAASDSNKEKRDRQQTQKDMMGDRYHRLCRDTMQEWNVYGSGRHCYWHPAPILYLRVKAELVNVDPVIVVFHHVISDEEIDLLQQLSFPKLSPSRLSLAQVAHERQLVRVSQTGWVFDDESVGVSRVSSRVQLVTGLSTRSLRENTHAEPYQVVNYGLGGMNGLHEDSVRIPRVRGQERAAVLRTSGDRTATWMYYLSDVRLGGATVFPLLGAGVRPQKGSAVFWFNLKRSGKGDVRMVHAGCPVLLGEKWVANKWVRETGNVFTRPCLLDPTL